MFIHQTSVYFGIVTSGALAGYIGQQYGWSLPFFSFGAAGIVVAIITLRALREPQRGQADPEEFGGQSCTQELKLRARLADTFGSPTAVILMLAFLGMSLVNAAYLTWTPTLLYEKFGLSLAKAGFHATFWHHLGAAIGVLLGGRIADNLALHSRLSRPLVQLAGLLLGAPFIFVLGWSDSNRVVFASLALFGFFRGLYDSNLFASLYEVVRPGARATATGFMIAVAFLGGGFSPVLIGRLSDSIGLGPALATTSVCYLAAGLLVLTDCLVWFRKDVTRVQGAILASAGTWGAR
jgi:predicted MFS family arabinose efflux permease